MNRTQSPVQEPSPPSCPRRRVRGVLLGFGAVLAVALAYSCSVERDYKTLRIFFDGVPDPNAKPAPVEEQRLGATDEKGRINSPRPPKKPTGSSHSPYVNRECDSCHKFEITGADRPTWMFGAPKLLAPVEELCARCHEPPETRFVHGPVAMLRCDLCHTAHDSRYPNLLKKESINETCASCHLGETFVTEEAHGYLEDRECSVCHDPHGSENSLFLREGTPALGEVLLQKPEESATPSINSSAPSSGP